MKIIDSVWFTPMSGETIGIVTIENDMGERKAYLGVASGTDEQQDAEHIAENGTPVYGSMLQSILESLKKL